MQGNPSRLGPPGGFSAEIPKPFRGYSDRFPVIRNREISASEHGFPPGRPHAGPRATIVPASSIRELLAFWVGRLLAHYAVRRELLDHVVVLNEDHLRRLLREYVDYYNSERVHTSIGDAPVGRPVESRPSADARVVSLPRVGGLHHRYRWREAA